MGTKTLKKEFTSSPAYFVWLCLVVVSVYMLREGFNHQNENLMTIMILLMTPPWLFTYFMIKGTKYTITEELNLKIKCPPFKWPEIPISDITEVHRTRNPISAPAPSLKRLKVMYGNGKSLIISPFPIEEFAYELNRINPRIKVEI